VGEDQLILVEVGMEDLEVEVLLQLETSLQD
jgi:hypothetical protein